MVKQDIQESGQREEQTLTLEQALILARELHQSERYDAAEELYRRILEVAPNHPEPLNFLAILSYQKSEYVAAVDYMQRALKVMPDNADLHNNLGNLFKMLDKPQEAFDAYRRAVELNPDLAHAHNNIAILYRQENRIDEAILAYQKALELNPGLVDILLNLGNLYADQNRYEAAAEAFRRTIELDENYLEGYKALGTVLCELQRFEEAAEVFKRLLEKSPRHPIAEHMLAVCTGREIPRRASNEYIHTLFDHFADSFEEKLSALKYRCPELVADAVAQRFPDAAKELEILDAGCGTGWCGPLLQPYARKLVGIDLSPRMLEKAKNRGYSELVVAELEQYMRTHPASYDIVVSADTMIYFGALEEVLAAAAVTLRPQGWLIFTLEKNPEDYPETGYHMTASGRYSHQHSYVERCLREAGFGSVKINAMHGRLQHGRPVLGMLIAARLG